MQGVEVKPRAHGERIIIAITVVQRVEPIQVCLLQVVVLLLRPLQLLCRRHYTNRSRQRSVHGRAKTNLPDRARCSERSAPPSQAGFLDVCYTPQSR